MMDRKDFAALRHHLWMVGPLKRESQKELANFALALLEENEKLKERVKELEQSNPLRAPSWDVDKYYEDEPPEG
jgi:hypothetical protein